MSAYGNCEHANAGACAFCYEALRKRESRLLSALKNLIQRVEIARGDIGKQLGKPAFIKDAEEAVAASEASLALEGKEPK